MNYVFYDLETTGRNKDWSQIIQFAAILVDKNLEEIDRFEAKCNLKPGIVPEPEALLVNNNKISEITGLNNSHFKLISEIKNKIQNWSPAIYLGYNSIQFDEEILRKTFFKSLFDAYSTQLNGNKRGDILNFARSAFFFDNKIFKTIKNLKGKDSFRLEDLSYANKINHNAHDAMGDVKATIELAKIIRNKLPKIWSECIRNCYKDKIEDLIYNENLFFFLEFNFGLKNFVPLKFLFIHPKYKFPQSYNLLIDPEPLFKLNFSELKARFNESPKLIKSFSLNKNPPIFSFKDEIEKTFLPKNLSIKNILDRARKLEGNLDFIEKLKLIVIEIYEEKKDIDPQIDIYAEESLYSGGFPSNNDKYLMNKFHDLPWDEKFNLSRNFEDDRFKYFAERLIYEESPNDLPKDIFNKIHKSIALQILSLDNVNWSTLPKAFKQIDDLREKYFNDDNKEKIQFLLEINEFLEKMQSIYEPAKKL